MPTKVSVGLSMLIPGFTRKSRETSAVPAAWGWGEMLTAEMPAHVPPVLSVWTGRKAAFESGCF